MLHKILLGLILFGCFTAFSQQHQTMQDTLSVGYTSAPPFIVENGSSLSGINVWLWKKVADDLDLNYRLVPMAFSDMLDSLESGGVDVSINPLTITSKRSKVMEFTHSFYASNSTIAVAERSSYQKLLSYLKGFFNQNFLKGLLVLLLIIFLFGLIGWYFERKEDQQFRKGYRGIWDGVWWSAVTLTTVGYGDKTPKTRMGKIAALVLMFGGLLFISGLTASIASSLTVTQLNSNPDGFHAFKERSIGTIKNSSSNSFLNEHFFKDIQLFEAVVPGLNQLRDGEIEAFMYDEPIMKYRIQEDSTLAKLQLLPVRFDVQFYAFGLAKHNTALEQMVSQRILEIMETQEWQLVLNEYGLTEL